MKLKSIVLAGLLITFFSTWGFAQSLADLAKKEKERRQAIKTEVKVITNDQTSKYRNAPVAVTTGTPTTAQPDEKPAGAAEGAKEKPASDEPVDFQGRPESFWRQTFADARQKVALLENESNVLILKFNDLQNRFYRESDGFKQQEIQREMQKTIYEQDVNKENLAKARAELTDLEMEARKSGALPGWIK
jgi:hypothetical protein